MPITGYKTMNEDCWKAAVAVFLAVAVVPAAASQSVQISGLEEQDLNKSIGQDGVTFTADYLNKTVSYKELLIPEAYWNDLKSFDATYKSKDSTTDLTISFEFKGSKKASESLPKALYGYKYSADMKEKDKEYNWKVSSSINNGTVKEDADFTAKIKKKDNKKSIEGSLTRTEDKTTIYDTKNFNASDITQSKTFTLDAGVISPKVSSHNEHLIVDYKVKHSIHPNYSNNHLNNQTNQYLDTQQDIYSGPETDLFAIKGAFTHVEDGVQNITTIPDNRFDDRKEVTILVAHPERYQFKNLYTGQINQEKINNPLQYYKEAEQRVKDNDLSREILVPEENQSQYQYRAVNVTLPADTTQRITAQIHTDVNHSVKGLKMYVIGSIGGTTTYERGGDLATVFSDGFEDGDASEWSSINSGDGAREGSFAYEGSWYGQAEDCDVCDSWESGGQIYRTFSDPFKPRSISFAIAYDQDYYNDLRLFFTDNSTGDRLASAQLTRPAIGDDLKVNGNNYGDVAGQTWYYIKLSNIDWSSNTIGAIYLDGSQVDTNVGFNGGTVEHVDKILLSADAGGTGSKAYLDAVQFREFNSSNSPPQFQEINSQPVTWKLGQSFDWNATITDPDGNLDTVEARMLKEGTEVKSWTTANNPSGDTYGLDNFYTFSDRGSYTLEINASDTNGAFNKSITTQEVKLPKVELNTPDASIKDQYANPIDFDFTPKCYSSGGCSTAGLFLNYTGIRLTNFITSSESEWRNNISSASVSTDGSGNLVIEPFRYEWYDHGRTSNHPTTKSELDDYFNGNVGSFQSSGTHTRRINWHSDSKLPDAKPSYLPADSYAWKAEGYIYAPESGTYTFGVDSDDASDVIIDGNQVTGWYDGHGTQGSGSPDYSGHTGSVSLDKGYHKFKARMEEGGGADGFSVGWQKPSDSSLSVIPYSSFYNGGVYTSRTFSTSDVAGWSNSDVEVSTPTGTSADVDYGTNKSGTWTYYDTISGLPETRYTRFKATLSTNDTSVTPKISSVGFDAFEQGVEVWTDIKSTSSVSNNTVNTISYDFKNQGATKLLDKSYTSGK